MPQALRPGLRRNCGLAGPQISGPSRILPLRRQIILQGQSVAVALPLTATLGHTFTVDLLLLLKHVELTLDGVDRLLGVPRQGFL
jgi:hypothetical protein